MGIDDSYWLIRSCHTEYAGVAACCRIPDIIAVLVVIICRDIQTAKECGIETDIELACILVIDMLGLGCAEIGITPLCSCIGCIEWIAYAVHQIELIVVGPYVSARKHIQYLVAPGSTQLQEVEPLHILHKLLIGDIPSERNVWRHRPLVARSQTAGTALYQSYIEEKSVVITIVTEQRDIVAIYGGIGTCLVVVLVIVLQLAIYMMLLREVLVIVERCVPYATANPIVVVGTGTHVGICTLHGRESSLAICDY